MKKFLLDHKQITAFLLAAFMLLAVLVPGGAQAHAETSPEVGFNCNVYGDELVVTVYGSSIEDISSLTYYLHYNPELLQFKDSQYSKRLKNAMVSVNNDNDTVKAAIVDLGGTNISWEELFTIRFQMLFDGSKKVTLQQTIEDCCDIWTNPVSIINGDCEKTLWIEKTKANLYSFSLETYTNPRVNEDAETFLCLNRNDGFYAGSFKIYYDETLLSFNGITSAGSDNLVIDSHKQSDGIVQVAFTSSQLFESKGRFLNLHFIPLQESVNATVEVNEITLTDRELEEVSLNSGCGLGIWTGTGTSQNLFCISSPESVVPDEEFAVDISIADNSGFAALTAELEYDAELFEYLGEESAGEISAGTLCSITNPKDGVVKIGLISSSNITDNGSIAKLRFKGKNAIGATGDFSLSVTELTDENAQKVNASVKGSSTGLVIHQWDTDYTIDKEPTCTEAGSRSIHCADCDEVKDVQEISALGHDWSFVDFTWTEKTDGGYDVTANYVCKNDATHEQSVTALVEAKTEDATCTKPGSIAYTATVSKADSLDQTVHTDSKTVTGEALGHSWGEWETVEQSTCILAGQEVRTCQNDPSHKEYRAAELAKHDLVMTSANEATCTEAGNIAYYTCAVCGKIFSDEAGTKEISKSDTVISATDHHFGDWTVIKDPTYTEVGITERECTICGHKEQAEIPVLGKKGWIKEDGSWYFYNDDGSKATSTWKKDSKGWCWLQSDGAMLTNGWAKDSKGWCWIGASGYMVEQTKWIKVAGSWYHITKGYRDQSKWMKDSKGWCYLGSNGHMVTNGWAKDSKGWCWMGSDGYWVSNRWIQSGGQWYYIKSNHYMAVNEWAKDSGGWMYMDGNGRITKSKWVKSGGYWYYMKSNGYMATGTQTIGGKTYKFDSAGRWVA